MTRKLMLGAIVAVAFLAGTITTGGIVYASFDQCSNNPPQGVSKGKPFLEIWQAICDLETQVSGLENQVNNIDTQDDLLGFYKVRVQETVTADEAMNGAVREGTCDAGDFPISIGWFGSPGNTIDGMSLSEMAGGSASVFVRNLAEGSAYGVGVNCADYSPVHEDP